MILGAGRGTRLGPLTAHTPKVLAPVLGLPLLERLAAWLGRGGVEAIALNSHHLGAAVAAHVAAHMAATAGRGGAFPPIRLYPEAELLGTGGGVLNVADFWGGEPLLVWNGDVVADLAPAALMARMRAGGADATLAVQARESGSFLLIDEGGLLCGLDSPRRGEKRMVREPQGAPRRIAFNGISVLAPALREFIARPGPFDLVDALLQAVAAGARVDTLDAGGAFWGTTGDPERLAALEAALRARPELLAGWTP